jgi:hypothetical protein
LLQLGGIEPRLLDALAGDKLFVGAVGEPDRGSVYRRGLGRGRSR